ncbi:hypothetical protein FOA52_007866 [Chlamydomonas sp. UWO 241]|nr:hypothetical protein FOA52_007866 [Chlamydomonas sp. UWO 241]
MADLEIAAEAAIAARAAAACAMGFCPGGIVANSTAAAMMAAEAVAGGGIVAAGGTVAMLQGAGAVAVTAPVVGTLFGAATLPVLAMFGAATLPVLAMVGLLLVVGSAEQAAGAREGPQPEKFTVATKEGWGRNVTFYAFDSEDESLRFFHNLSVSLPKVMFCPAGHELRAGDCDGCGRSIAAIRHHQAFLYGSSPRHGLSGFVHELLRPGNVVALHSKTHGRFLRVVDDCVNGYGGLMDLADLPGHWDSELFTVVDAGNGTVALHSHSHNRFVRIIGDDVDARGGVMDTDKLPGQWDSERLTVVDAGNGMVALHSHSHGGFLKMEKDGAVNAREMRDVDLLPNVWDSERFTVKLVRRA